MSLIIGSHVSYKSNNQLVGSTREAIGYGSNTFMFYTGAPQNTNRGDIRPEFTDEAKKLMEDNGIDINNVIVHAPYIVNLANMNNFNFSVSFLKEEVKRCSTLGIKYMVLHPGSAVNVSRIEAIENISKGLNLILDNDYDVKILLETMAGKGNEIGRSFEELARIIELVDHKDKLGICFDTCHTHDSGYDIIDNFDEVIKDFDSIIGLDLLKVFHINGSLNPRGARKDRHANIGALEDNPRGRDFIGAEALKYIVHHEVTKGKPIILETPWLDKKTNLYTEEIAYLRGDTNII